MECSLRNWISIVDKKPNAEEVVLVWTHSHHINHVNEDITPIITLGKWDEGYNDFVNEDWQVLFAKFWRPLCFHLSERIIKREDR